MKLSKLLFAIVGLLGFVTGGVAQNVETNKTHGILGYLDPKTGAFRALPRAVRPSADASITPTSGTYTFTFNITVSSALPASAGIYCSASASVTDDVEGFFSNDVSITATRKGSTATCTLTMPYEWYLNTPSKDLVSLSWSVYTSTDIGKEGYTEDAEGSLPTKSVPANGATTAETVTTTI
jgi:hypothetical protein